MWNLLSVSFVIEILTQVNILSSSLEKLEEPISTLCSERTVHATSPAGIKYFFSWRGADETDPENFTEARNFCRRQCMELVSLETFAENEWIKSIVLKDKISSVYTSGHLCDFEGCDRPDLQPLDAYGWFWTGSEERISNTYWREFNDWSNDDVHGPQPDNREFTLSSQQESCLALVNSACDGIHWHDVTCDRKNHFICEDSLILLNYVETLYSGIEL